MSPPRAPHLGGLPLLGSALSFFPDPLGFLERAKEVHGDVVEFRLPGADIVLFSHPAAIDQLLIGEREHMVKDKPTRELSILLGDGLLLSHGATWRKHRRLVQPGFHRDRIATYADVMVRFAERAADALPDGETRDLHADMMRLTLDIVAKTLFDVEIADVARTIEHALEILMARYSGAGVLIPPAVPTPGNLRAKRAIAELDAIVYAMIKERRASGDKGDLLSMLIAATSDEDGSLDDVQVRDEAMTLLLAGHETTALTLGFALHLLARHPEAYEKLLAEIHEVLGDRPATPADLPRLRWADAVVRESMRLYPPAWAIGREPTTRCTIAGHTVEPGTQLWASQWLVHKDPRWFADPHAFLPGRWTEEFTRALPKHAFFPFGGGPRVCIGNAFAQMEAVLVLVTLARRARFTLVDGRPLKVRPSVTLRPTQGIPLRVTRLASSRMA